MFQANIKIFLMPDQLQMTRSRYTRKITIKPCKELSFIANDKLENYDYKLIDRVKKVIKSLKKDYSEVKVLLNSNGYLNISAK